VSFLSTTLIFYKLHIKLVQRLKRKQLTVPEEYSSMMDKVNEECKRNKISLSRHICQLAVNEYTSKSTENQIRDTRLPTIDKIFDYLTNIKKDLASEILRLYNRRELSDEEMIKIYLGNRMLQIQLENTKDIKRLVQPVNINSLIYSKRDTFSKIAIDTAKKILIDRTEKLKQEKREEEVRRLREAERKEIQEARESKVKKWREEHPGIPIELMYIPESEWDDYNDLEEISPEESDGN
jgi:predicted metal-binding transcription factor (methanogenesis marker protein 9)